MKQKMFLTTIIFLLSIVLIPKNAFAHCDGIDGPVVKAAEKALETENVDLVMIWVKKEFEEEIINTFKQTLSVRKLSNEAKQMADKYFFETLVRLHRLGEGAAYTGLKPAGRDLGKVIPAADKSIETNSVKELYQLLNDDLHNSLHNYFENVIKKKAYDSKDINAGREFVESYVEFVHFTERVHEATKILNESHHSISAGNITNEH